MTKEEFQTLKCLKEKLKCLKEKLENEVKELFNYIKKEYLDVLAFGEDSCYHHYNMNEEMIQIVYFDYGYDCYDSRDINIPINDFLSNPSEWADKWANNIRVEEQKKVDAAKKEKEKKEKKLLQYLKEKYGEL